MTTIILSTNSDGVARAYIIPEGDLTVERDTDYFPKGYPSWLSPTRIDSQRTKLVIDNLGEYTMLVGEAAAPDEGRISGMVKEAMSIIKTGYEQIKEEGRQSRRRTAAANLLESQGVKPKKAAKIAAALLDTVDEVK